MTQDQHRLMRHIWLLIAIKLAVLFLIWWLFIRDNNVHVDDSSTAEHFAAPIAPVAPQSSHLYSNQRKE